MLRIGTATGMMTLPGNGSEMIQVVPTIGMTTTRIPTTTTTLIPTTTVVQIPTAMASLTTRNGASISPTSTRATATGTATQTGRKYYPALIRTIHRTIPAVTMTPP